MSYLRCVTAAAFLLLLSAFQASGYKYETKYLTVPVDHFSFTSNATFKMRYLVNETFWNKHSGPIFFYTGNEGDITMFSENTGFMWEIASEFKASVVFAEHRYYGESMPFGNKSFANQENLGYLTAHQALEDYVDLITFLRGEKENIPVIAFGGSYGGMLSAWFRMKYPHIVQGAIAASAPILEFEGMTKCSSFNRILSSDYTMAGEECSNSIRKSWAALDQMSKSNDGLSWLSKAWRTCKPLTKAKDIEDLKDWLTDVYTNLGMTDYPYPTSFLMPLPANPIIEFCQYLTDSKLASKELLGQVFKAVNVYLNYTGSTKCLDLEQSADGALGTDGWDYQACTEMVMPICSDGVFDMFEPKPWDEKKYAADCVEKFPWVKPEPHLVAKRYGGLELAKLSSNIIFSNGLKDPWTSGGVVESQSETVIAVIIPEGAHHLDLRSSNPADPQSVRAARNIYKKQIRSWISDYKN